MPVKKYLNFDLQVEKSKEGFQARVLNSPAGHAIQELHQLYDRSELEHFLLRLSISRQRTRQFDMQQLEAAKKFGSRLFAALISGSIQRCLRNSLEAASTQGAGLRIRIQVFDPELASIPWEFLYHPSIDRFLCLSAELPIARYAELPSPIVAPSAIMPPLRILVMIPNLQDDEYAPMDVEEEWAILFRATRNLQRQGLLIMDRLEPASLPALRRQLKQKEYNLFHFVGRSSLINASGEGVLVVENEQKTGLQISGRELGLILKDHPALQLAVIDACEGARTAKQGIHALIAQGIIQAGIPAVVTMQFPITAHTAITFNREFYRLVVNSNPVDLALVEARRAVRNELKTLEWASPVLFMGSPQGVTFHVAALPAHVTPGLRRPLANLFVRQGPQAGMNFPLMGESYLIGRDEELSIFIQDTQISRRHAQITFNSLGFWIEDLGSTNGTYVNGVRISGKAPLRDKDVIRLGSTTLIFDQASLPKASFSSSFLAPPVDETDKEEEEPLQDEVATLWAEAQAARAQQQWDTVIIRLQAILSIDPAHSRARAELAFAQQKLTIQNLYAEAQSAQENQDWETAMIKLQAILNLDPNHPDARLELQKTQQRQQIALLYQQAKQALAQNNRALAAARLQAVLAIDPTHLKAREDFEAILKGK